MHDVGIPFNLSVLAKDIRISWSKLWRNRNNVEKFIVSERVLRFVEAISLSIQLI